MKLDFHSLCSVANEAQSILDGMDKSGFRTAVFCHSSFLRMAGIGRFSVVRGADGVILHLAVLNSEIEKKLPRFIAVARRIELIKRIESKNKEALYG